MSDGKKQKWHNRFTYSTEQKPQWYTRFQHDAKAMVLNVDLEKSRQVAANIIASTRRCIEAELPIPDPVAQYLSEAAIEMFDGTEPKQALNLAREKGEKITPSRFDDDDRTEIAGEVIDEHARIKRTPRKARPAGEPLTLAINEIAVRRHTSPATVHRAYKWYKSRQIPQR